MNSKIRVLIVDDQPIYINGLAALINFQADMFVVGHALDGEEALRIFAGVKPDVSLIDLHMPEGMGGLELMHAIRKMSPNARMIALTILDDEESIYRALEAGAQSYLIKGRPPETVLNTIRTVHAGETWIPDEVGSKLAERVKKPQLTPRQLEILRCVDEGMTDKEIAAHLHLATSTVKTHLVNIYKKLGVHSRTSACAKAKRRGLLQS